MKPPILIIGSLTGLNKRLRMELSLLFGKFWHLERLSRLARRYLQVKAAVRIKPDYAPGQFASGLAYLIKGDKNSVFPEDFLAEIFSFPEASAGQNYFPFTGLWIMDEKSHKIEGEKMCF